MLKVKYVKQEDDLGCVPACLAMIFNKTYKEITDDWANDFTKDGLFTNQIIDYLNNENLNIVHVDLHNMYRKSQHLKELLKPFADIHILSVRPKIDSTTYHCVIMDKEGIIYDPQWKSKRLEDYYLVGYVLGIFY